MTDEALVTAVRRDLGLALAAEAPGRTVGQVQLVAGGRSAVTAFADLVGPGDTTERVAVRAVARGADDLAVGTLAEQFALLELLGSEPVLAPRPLLLADGLDGTEYDLLVTGYVAGRVPQPWRRAGRAEIAELRASEQFREDFVRTMARIHAVSATRLPPGLRHEGDGSASTHAARTRARCLSSFRASGVFAEDPVLTWCLLWLEENAPTTTFSPGLVHGDYRLGNLVVDPQGRLCGVLDWELAEAGETLSDVAWLCGPQGQVDGLAAGLLEPDELVGAYELATGHTVEPDLFAHLRLEGTLRTTAVWARLGVVERQRGNTAVAVRCQESVLELIGLAALSVGLVHEPEARVPQPLALAAGTAVLAGRLREALVAESLEAGPVQPPAVRHTASVLHRLAGLLGTGEYEQYTGACARLGAADDQGTSPGVALSRLLRRRHDSGVRLDDTGSAASELRHLVAWSATAPIAFGNLLGASGNTTATEDGRP